MKSFAHRATPDSCHWPSQTRRSGPPAVLRLHFPLELAQFGLQAFTFHFQLHVCSWSSLSIFSGLYSCGQRGEPQAQQLCFRSLVLSGRTLVGELTCLFGNLRPCLRTMPFGPTWLASALKLPFRVCLYLREVKQWFLLHLQFCLLRHSIKHFEHCLQSFHFSQMPIRALFFSLPPSCEMMLQLKALWRLRLTFTRLVD